MQNRKLADVLAEQPEETKKRNAETFEKLCVAARNLNKADIYQLMFERHLADINFAENHLFHDAKTVVMQMAEEGNDQAVDFLIDVCHASIDDAVEGYARAKRIEKVEEYFKLYNVMNRAIRGYAYTEQVDRVENLLNRGASMAEAAYGYARAGKTNQVDNLLTRMNEKISVLYSAIEGYCHSEYTAQAEELIVRGMQILDQRAGSSNAMQKLFKIKEDHLSSLCHAALRAYMANDYYHDQTKLLKLLASTQDANVFNHFTAYIKSNKSSVGLRLQDMTLAELIRKATVLRQEMGDKKISYDTALASGIADVKPEPKSSIFAFLKTHHPAAKVEPVQESGPEVPKANI